MKLCSAEFWCCAYNEAGRSDGKIVVILKFKTKISNICVYIHSIWKVRYRYIDIIIVDFGGNIWNQKYILTIVRRLYFLFSSVYSGINLRPNPQVYAYLVTTRIPIILTTTQLLHSSTLSNLLTRLCSIYWGRVIIFVSWCYSLCVLLSW